MPVKSKVEFQDFPIELIHEVLQLTDRSTLISLALVSKGLRNEAECQIYASIRITHRTNYKKALSCLELLGSRPQKAALIKRFAMDYLETPIIPCSHVEWLCKALLSMTNLKHLHLRFSSVEQRCMANPINDVLRRCTFSLNTFFSPDYITLVDWVERQPLLQVIGIEFTKHDVPDDRQLSVYKELALNPNRQRPLLFYGIPHYNYAIIQSLSCFPAFSATPWQADLIQNALLAHEKYVCVNSLTIMFDDFSTDFPRVVHSLSSAFPIVKSLVVYVQNRDFHLVRLETKIDPEILVDHVVLNGQNSEDVADALSILPHLQTLYVVYAEWRRPFTQEPYQPLRIRLAKEWASKSRNLRRVWFPDLSHAERDERIGEWFEGLPRRT